MKQRSINVACIGFGVMGLSVAAFFAGRSSSVTTELPIVPVRSNPAEQEDVGGLAASLNELNAVQRHQPGETSARYDWRQEQYRADSDIDSRYKSESSEARQLRKQTWRMDHPMPK